jgi:hypothetical protein
MHARLPVIVSNEQKALRVYAIGGGTRTDFILENIDSLESKESETYGLLSNKLSDIMIVLLDLNRLF